MNSTGENIRLIGVRNGSRAQIDKLFFTDGYTDIQIAKEITMSVTTVRVHLHAIRQKMRRIASGKCE